MSKVINLEKPSPTGWRMYFFVPYNISDIQKGIQAGHCAEQYAKYYHSSKDWQEYVSKDKTWMIMNGGTTNKSKDPLKRGSLNLLMDSIMENHIPSTVFYEPNLNDGLSAICFLVDEKVYDFEIYPNYEDWLNIIPPPVEDNFKCTDGYSTKYFNLIGGNKNFKKNLFLKTIIENARLA